MLRSPPASIDPPRISAEMGLPARAGALEHARLQSQSCQACRIEAGADSNLQFLLIHKDLAAFAFGVTSLFVCPRLLSMSSRAQLQTYRCLPQDTEAFAQGLDEHTGLVAPCSSRVITRRSRVPSPAWLRERAMSSALKCIGWL